MIKVQDIPTPSYAELQAIPREIGFLPTENPAPKHLTPEQIDFYNREGYVMPFNGLSADEAKSLSDYFDGVLDAFTELGHGSYAISTAHLRFGRIYDLMFHPGLVGPVTDILGEDVVAWGSHFFCKMPHDGKRVAWHQDSIYWPMSPSRTVTVWLAIDDADPENANMRFVPKSHAHGMIGFRESMSEADVLGLVVDSPDEYGDPAVDVTLKAGQFSMHSDLTLHGSEANESDRRRCGLTIRYAAASVKAWHGWEHKGIVVSGEDTNGNWKNHPRP